VLGRVGKKVGLALVCAAAVVGNLAFVLASAGLLVIAVSGGISPEEVTR